MAGTKKGELTKKKKKGSQPLFKDLSRSKAGPPKREEEGRDLLQIRVPHGLIKMGQ